MGCASVISKINSIAELFSSLCVYCWNKWIRPDCIRILLLLPQGGIIICILELPRWCSNSRSENSSSSRDPCVCMCVTTSLSTCHGREGEGKWRVGTGSRLTTQTDVPFRLLVAVRTNERICEYLKTKNGRQLFVFPYSFFSFNTKKKRERNKYIFLF